jgi:hypothetical protein
VYLPTPRCGEPNESGGPYRYTILKFAVGAFRLDSLLLAEGGILKNVVMTSIIITASPLPPIVQWRMSPTGFLH